MIGIRAPDIDKGALQSGDLVFFATNGGTQVSHAGIYVAGAPGAQSLTAWPAKPAPAGADLAGEHVSAVLLRLAHPPDHIAHVVGHQHPATLIVHHADRAPHGLAVLVEKPGQQIDGLA
uniref:NLPC_P60 domain-containing protein n=1 Tax=Steinernema glaseri TaxID=37863 RepID=A0A1I8ACC5_9BILA